MRPPLSSFRRRRCRRRRRRAALTLDPLHSPSSTGPESCSCVRDQGGFAFCMKPDEQDEDADETPCCTSSLSLSPHSRRGHRADPRSPFIPLLRFLLPPLLILDHLRRSSGVKGTFCETMYPDWVVCGSNETAPRISSSAIDTVPLHPTPTSTTSSREAIMAISGSKGKDKGGKHGKPSHHDDDDDMRWGSGGGWGWDRPHKPNWPHKPRPPPSRPSVINKPNELRLSPKWNINARPQRREYWFTIDERMGSPDGCASPPFLFLPLSSARPFRASTDFDSPPSASLAVERPMCVLSPSLCLLSLSLSPTDAHDVRHTGSSSTASSRARSSRPTTVRPLLLFSFETLTHEPPPSCPPSRRRHDRRARHERARPAHHAALARPGAEGHHLGGRALGRDPVPDRRRQKLHVQLPRQRRPRVWHVLCVLSFLPSVSLEPRPRLTRPARLGPQGGTLTAAHCTPTASLDRSSCTHPRTRSSVAATTTSTKCAQSPSRRRRPPCARLTLLSRLPAQIVMLHDWYHNTSDYLVNSLLSPQGLNGVRHSWRAPCRAPALTLLSPLAPSADLPRTVAQLAAPQRRRTVQLLARAAWIRVQPAQSARPSRASLPARPARPPSLHSRRRSPCVFPFAFIACLARLTRLSRSAVILTSVDEHSLKVIGTRRLSLLHLRERS